MRNYRLLSRLLLPAFCLTLMTFTSCRQTINPTVLTIKDSIRHYYPVIQKDEVKLVYELTNNGTEPLVITDILPACSAVTLESQMPEVIPPGKSENVNFIYHSEMNVGYVSHDIRIYGNILPKGEALITFDLHVVRPTLEGSDYEEIFFAKQTAIKNLVDGDLGEKGYWVGGDCTPENYSRYYNNPLN